LRDVSGTLGKHARLTIEGGDITVDANVIEQLREPLLHLIRNALDHGIELPNRRKLSGKGHCGRITVRARREAGTFVVQIEDDGAGLSRRRIAARALAQGLFRPGGDRRDEQAAGEAMDKLSDAELLALVFVPGFSTAEHVTDLSGRSVGMDVVKRVVEAMHGTVGLASQEGTGTTVTIRLPVSSALMDGFAVGLDGDVFRAAAASVEDAG
jgi:two-component system, chemotaxis family, sensor kinase CheA